MIELISQERCVSCDICVRICPRHVFDAVEDAPPSIARGEDCQTCFMCELYCPTDALYVAPHADVSVHADEVRLNEEQLLGSFVRNMGWQKGKPGGTDQDTTHLIRKLRSASPTT